MILIECPKTTVCSYIQRYPVAAYDGCYLVSACFGVYLEGKSIHVFELAGSFWQRWEPIVNADLFIGTGLFGGSHWHSFTMFRPPIFKSLHALWLSEHMCWFTFRMCQSFLERKWQTTLVCKSLCQNMSVLAPEHMDGYRSSCQKSIFQDRTRKH